MALAVVCTRRLPLAVFEKRIGSVPPDDELGVVPPTEDELGVLPTEDDDGVSPPEEELVVTSLELLDWVTTDEELLIVSQSLFTLSSMNISPTHSKSFICK